MSEPREKVSEKGWRLRQPLIERAVGSADTADALAKTRRSSAPLPSAQATHPSAQAPARDASRQAAPGDPPAHRTSRYAEIDLDRLEKLGLVTPKASRSRTKEEFRIIKRAILQNAFQQNSPHRLPGNMVMVTSARPNEGKTFTAINLAISIALERDYTVLLIDGDLGRPNVMNTLGLESGKGIIDVLEDPSIDLADVLIRTNIDKLSILPAGSLHHLSTELLASHGMSNLVSDIAKRYHDRIILFDAPPILATSETGALAMHVGQIILVVEANKTPKSVVKEALGMLDTGARVGVILNRCSTGLGTAQFGSYYRAERT